MRDFFVYSVDLTGYTSFFVFAEERNAPNWEYHGFFQAEEDPAKAKELGLEEYKICYGLQDHICVLRKNVILEGERHVTSFYASPEPRAGYIQWNVYTSPASKARFFSPVWQRGDFELELAFWVPDDRLSLPCWEKGELNRDPFNPTLSVVLALDEDFLESDLLTGALSTMARQKPEELVIAVEGAEKKVREYFTRLSSLEDFPRLVLVSLPPEYKEKKTYQGLSTLYNAGFLKARGDVILFQDPSCLHVGELLSHARRVPPGAAILYPCLGAERPGQGEKILEELETLEDSPREEYEEELSEMGRWLQHPRFNNCRKFYGMALRRKDLEALGGFSQIFAGEPGFQWEEFIYRASKNLPGGISTPGVRGFSPWLYRQSILVEEKEPESKKNLELYRELTEANGKPFPSNGIMFF